MAYQDTAGDASYEAKAAAYAGGLQESADSANDFANKLRDTTDYNDKVKALIQPIGDEAERQIVASVHSSLTRGFKSGLNRVSGGAAKSAEEAASNIQNKAFKAGQQVVSGVKQKATTVAQDLQNRTGSITRQELPRPQTGTGQFSDEKTSQRFLNGEDRPDPSGAGKGGGQAEEALGRDEKLPTIDTQKPADSAADDLFKDNDNDIRPAPAQAAPPQAGAPEPSAPAPAPEPAPAPSAPPPIEPVADPQAAGQAAGDAGKAAESAGEQAAKDGLKEGESTLEKVGETEAAGGGPEDPLADVAAAGIALASVFGQKALEKKAPTEAPPTIVTGSQASFVRGL